MNEPEEFERTAADDALDRELLALKRFAPRPGFENRVLARVIRRIPAPAVLPTPTPAPVRARRTPGRRLWWGAGLAAAGSTVWTAVGASALSSAGGLAALNAWIGTHVGDRLSALALQGASVAGKTLLTSGAAAFDAVGNAGVFGIAAAVAITPVLSAWGLFLTLKQRGGKRTTAYAAR